MLGLPEKEQEEERDGEERKESFVQLLPWGEGSEIKGQ